MLIAFSVLLMQCDANQDKFERKYIVENSTKHNLKIDHYQFGKFIATKSTIGNEIVEEGISTGGGVNHSASASEAYRADSIILIWDNKKIQSYKANSKGYFPKERNLLWDEHYAAENNTLYRFILIEEDYTNAQDL